MLVVVDRGPGGVIGGRVTLSYGAKTCSTPLQIDPSKLQQGLFESFSKLFTLATEKILSIILSLFNRESSRLNS